jgi:ribosomal protein S6--L-glutamate ligase
MNIAVLSRSPGLYSTQSIVRACQKRHHQVYVLDHQKFDLMAGTSGLQLYYNGHLIEHIHAIIPRIGATSTAYGAAVIRHFELQGVYSVTDSEALLRARDKFKCMQYLAAAQIPVPVTLFANMVQQSSELIKNNFSPPIVLKIKESTHGLGVILSENHQNALSTLEAFHHVGQETLVQEFIRESGGNDIRVFIVDDQVAGAMKREAASGDFRSNLHRGGTSSIVHLTEREIEIAKRASKLLGLKVAGVDLLRSSKGPLVLEVNASPGLEGIETTTGIDIASKIVDLIERDTLKTKYKHGR